MTGIVPANTNRTVAVDARAQAAAGEGPTRGRRVLTVRHRQGRTARPERLETAVVVRPRHGKDDGPVGTTVLLTTASVANPLHPFDDEDAHSLMEHGCIKEAKQPWELGHPPQQTDRAVRVHELCTLLMFAGATAHRLACEREAMGGEPAG